MGSLLLEHVAPSLGMAFIWECVTYASHPFALKKFNMLIT